ncbi:RES family NAD+ phosphorylase [Limnobacter sp. P1]|uniref:RES family NAD+ phosphorylase n=1 Tax=Limnobacter olei TaxID=3031298 RepID=UPI0023B01A77|nr:RES family NAD+ phosphorylase [Limnobacter sp. P1]
MDFPTKPHLPGNLTALFAQIKQHLREVSRFNLPVELDEKVNQIIDYYEDIGGSTLTTEQTLYRARSHNVDQRHPHPISEMGAPPPFVARAGRVNVTGMPFLYLADDIETCIAEIRPWTGALVSVGKFQASEPLSVLDFTKKRGLEDAENPASALHSLLSESDFVHKHFGAPVHIDDPYSYLPMQYLVDKVKARKFDGIRFKSMQKDKGINTVVFNPANLACVDVQVFGVKLVKYEAVALVRKPNSLNVGGYEIEAKDW